MNATTINNAVSIISAGILPNGVKVLEIGYDGTHDGYINAPVALNFDGVQYGRSSHNSDSMRITYRSDKKFATK